MLNSQRFIGEHCTAPPPSHRAGPTRHNLARRLVSVPPCLFDSDAPILRTFEVVDDLGRTLWRVHCPFCRDWHYHGPGFGHRVEHCPVPTPFSETGYNIALVRRWKSA